jgi:hypothetical protein
MAAGCGHRWFSAGEPSSGPYIRPARIAPAIGATQNSHNCSKAQPPAKSAGPVLRAGFTEVLVTGIPTR